MPSTPSAAVADVATPFPFASGRVGPLEKEYSELPESSKKVTARSRVRAFARRAQSPRPVERRVAARHKLHKVQIAKEIRRTRRDLHSLETTREGCSGSRWARPRVGTAAGGSWREEGGWADL